MSSLRIARLVPLVALLLLTGCRTYGGYETEAKTYTALQQTHRQFATELERAKADLNLLEEAAAENEALEPLADRFAGIVARHEQVLAEQQDLLRRLSPESSYRDLHRAFGAVVTDRRLTAKRYNRAVVAVQAAVRGVPVANAITPRSYYVVEPLDYARLDNADRLTMQEALRG